jgi:hypothetical protein
MGLPIAVELGLSWPHGRVSHSHRVRSEAFVIPERQSDAVAEGIEKVVLAVIGWVTNAKALDLVEQVIS